MLEVTLGQESQQVVQIRSLQSRHVVTLLVDDDRHVALFHNVLLHHQVDGIVVTIHIQHWLVIRSEHLEDILVIAIDVLKLGIEDATHQDAKIWHVIEFWHRTDEGIPLQEDTT